METHKKDFLQKFIKIKKDPEAFKILKNFHINKIKNHNEILKETLKDDIYRPFIFVHQINDNFNAINTWLKYTIGKSKNTTKITTKITTELQNNPILTKFKTVLNDKEAFHKLKLLFKNNNNAYLNDLKTLLKNQKFNKYIQNYEIDPYAHLVKHMLEKITSDTSNDMIQKSLKSLQINQLNLLEVLNSPEFKALKDKSKEQNQETLKNELRTLLKKKLTDSAGTGTSAIPHKDILLKILSSDSVSRGIEDIHEFKTKIKTEGFQSSVENTSQTLLLDSILEILPSDNRVALDSKYYENKMMENSTRFKGGKRINSRKNHLTKKNKKG